MESKGGTERTRGFTLIELLVTISVFVVLATIAVPSFTSISRSNRSASEANQVLSLVLLARSEAIRRNRSVSICGSVDGEKCSGAEAWENGIIVYVDPGAQQERDPSDARQELIQAVVPLSRVSQVSINVGTGALTYTPLGRTAGNALGTITVLPSAEKDQFAKKVVIARNGRPRVE